jgi:monoamine oxidase
MSPLDRRQFLKGTALATTALAARHATAAAAAPPPAEVPIPPVSAETAKPLERRGPPKKVVVLGAGLAGMSAAYELVQAGHSATLLEARTRPGGRVFTLREPFADGLHVDVGANTLPSSHQYVMKYVKLFGLALIPWLQPELAALGFIYHMRGKRIRPGDGSRLPYDLTPEERQLGMLGMLQKYFVAAIQEIGDPMAAGWPPAALEPYDRMSLAAMMRSRGATDDAVSLLGLQYYLDLPADGMDRTSALYVMRDAVLNPETDAILKLKGGMDVLPRAFAARLSDRIVYGAEAIRVEQRDKGVEVAFRRAGKIERLSGDYAICTVPFSVLDRVEFSPQLSAGKRRAVGELGYSGSTRVFLQCRRRFWMEEKLSGFAATDLPIMYLFDSTSDTSGERGMLEAYISGTKAHEMKLLPESERIAFTLEQVEKVHPRVREYFEGGASKVWEDDEWAGGAYSYYKPGTFRSLHPHVAAPEGRVYFAGEHASPWPHWMQGALWSGNRVAREINAA